MDELQQGIAGLQVQLQQAGQLQQSVATLQAQLQQMEQRAAQMAAEAARNASGLIQLSVAGR